jgi:hypothetical protein
MKVKIKVEHVRAAVQSAVGRNLKYPNLEFQEYLATFLSGILYEEDDAAHSGSTPNPK